MQCIYFPLALGLEKSSSEGAFIDDVGVSVNACLDVSVGISVNIGVNVYAVVNIDVEVKVKVKVNIVVDANI